MVHSSSGSGIFFQGDVQSQAQDNMHLGSFGNHVNSMPGNMRSNIVSISGDISNSVMNSVASSGPSIGASSLVTDANSGLSGGGPHLQRSASANTESCMRLPASPLSFSSNNISISGSSVIDGPSVMETTSNQDPQSQQVKRQGPHQGASTATSMPLQWIGQASLQTGPRIPGSFIQDNENIARLQKKPRLDIKQEDIRQQQMIQQLLQRQDSMQLQSPNSQLQSLIQQQRLRQQQQQQLLQSLPQVQRAHFLQQQQQQQQVQLRQQFQQQQSLQPASGMKRPYDSGVCSRRLMQYLYHQRQRPADNGISYWRKFVAEYYSPRAKKRWCLSLYDNVGHHSLGVFPQASMDAWHCDICRSKSGRGFEATFEILPRLNDIKFSSGVIDELLFLDMPREYRYTSGTMVLEYEHAVQESIYEQLRVVREGQLKLTFTPDLKILTWEFCARRHEELLPRRLVAPQVNQLLQVAQKCQSTIAESGSDGISQQDLQTNSNLVVTAGRQLARSLELQSLNDLGFSKRYVRCLQISEVVNIMKDLIDFCGDSKAGAVEGLKRFPRKTTAVKSDLEQLMSIPSLQGDRNTVNKLVSMYPGLNTQSNNMGGRGAPITLSSYQNMLMRQNSINSNSQPEASSSYNQTGYPFQTSLNSQQKPMFQNQQLPSPSLQQHMFHQLLQDMNNNNNSSGGGPKPSHSGQSGSMSRDGLRHGITASQHGITSSQHGIVSSVSSPRPPAVPTRSSSFKEECSADGGGNQKAAAGLPDLCDDFMDDIANEFIGNGFFNDELEGNGWK